MNPPNSTTSYAEALGVSSTCSGMKKGEITRVRLLAAISARLNTGVLESDLRISDICEDAGVAHGTFYRYFDDRPQAVEVVIGGFVDFLHQGLAANRSGEPGSPERVKAATLAYVILFRANAGLMRHLMSLSSGNTVSRDRFHDLNRDWYRRVARSIAMRRTQITGSTPESASALLTMAYALGGMVDEFLAQVYLRVDPALKLIGNDEVAVADLLTRVWCHGAYGDLRVTT